MNKKKRPGFEDIAPPAGDPAIPRVPEIDETNVERPPGILDEPLDLDEINPVPGRKRKHGSFKSTR